MAIFRRRRSHKTDDLTPTQFARGLAAGTFAAANGIALPRLTAFAHEPIAAWAPVLFTQPQIAHDRPPGDSTQTVGAMALTAEHLWWTTVTGQAVWSRRLHHVVTMDDPGPDLLDGLSVADACLALGDDWADVAAGLAAILDDECDAPEIMEDQYAELRSSPGHQVAYKSEAAIEFVAAAQDPAWPGGATLSFRVWRDSDLFERIRKSL